MNFSVKKIIQIACLNIGVVLGTVIAFSPGLLGLTFSLYNAAVTAITLGVSVLLLGVFGYGNYMLLFGKSELRIYKQQDFKGIGDYADTLDKLEEKCFQNQIKSAKNQVNRLDKKINTLKTLLGQFFTPEEMSYKSFMNITSSVTELFLDNIQNIINRVAIFDYDDYKEQVNSDPVSRVPAVYQEHIDFINTTISKNNEIIDKIDNLLLEVTKLTDVDTDVNSLPAIRELEHLIENTQYYKE